jgi:hypothetical protein
MINFIGIDCEIERGEYANGQPSLQLVAADSQRNQQADVFQGEPVGKATIHVVGVRLAKHETIIKDYSENAGIAAALEQAGVIKPTGRTIPVGFAKCPIVTVRPPYLRAL